MFEDSMDLIAKLPVVAATIYNNLYRDGAQPCAIDPEKDWSYNFTEMVGYKDPMFTELMRLYLTIHRFVLSGPAGVSCAALVFNSVGTVTLTGHISVTGEFFKKVHLSWSHAVTEISMVVRY